jgi:hypothetical protein
VVPKPQQWQLPGDLHRIISLLRYRQGLPADLISLEHSLERVAELGQQLRQGVVLLEGREQQRSAEPRSCERSISELFSTADIGSTPRAYASASPSSYRISSA